MNEPDLTCTSDLEYEAVGWTDTYFTFSGNPINYTFLVNGDSCLGRAKGEGYAGGGSMNLIPPGESGFLSQVITPTLPYTSIGFDDLHREHEDGELIYRIYGSDDGLNWALILATDSETMRIPPISGATGKSICMVFDQRIEIDILGNAVHSVHRVDPACTTPPLPTDINFTVQPFLPFAYLKVELEINPRDDLTGYSGIESYEWRLRTE